MYKRTLFFIFLLFSASTQANNTYTLFTYHNFPPFVVDKTQGLSFDLATHLSQEVPGVAFNTEVLPRKRLDSLLKSREMIVPWVAPLWLGDKNKTKYRWSNPIMEDASGYIYPASSAKQYTQPEDLIGLTVGGIRGYRFIHVDDLVQAGKVKRIDANSEIQLFKLMQTGRVALGLAPVSGSKYLIKINGWLGKYTINTHHRVNRHLMFHNIPQSVVDPVMKVLGELPHHPRWQQTLSRYGLKS